MIKTCVIPAAGRGERLKEITRGKSKEMLFYKGKRLIEHALDEAIKAGISNIIVISNSNKADLNSFISANYKSVTIVNQFSQSGLADAIYTAKEYILESKFLVILPDVISSPSMSLELIQDSERRQKYCVAYEYIPGKDCRHYGIIRGYPEETHTVLLRRIVEKPMAIDTDKAMAVVGRYVLPKDLLNLIPVMDAGVDSELQLSDAINVYLQKHPRSFIGCELSGRTVDAGRPESHK